MNSKYNSQREFVKNRNNQIQRGMTLTPKKSKGGGHNGYNSYKHSILNQNNTDLNVLDLQGIYEDHELDLLIEKYIEKTLKSKNFPLKVITHSHVDKIIIFNKVLRRYDKLKSLVLDPCNPYTYNIIPK